MKTLKLTEDELRVLLQSLDSVGWEALPENHHERRAAKSAKKKIETALEATESIRA
jgi:hypothetical protein